MKYNVVTITNNLEDYPEYKADTEKYPFLVKQIEDEVEVFIVEISNKLFPNCYRASEFFMINDVKEFETKET